MVVKRDNVLRCSGAEDNQRVLIVSFRFINGIPECLIGKFCSGNFDDVVIRYVCRKIEIGMPLTVGCTPLPLTNHTL